LNNSVIIRIYKGLLAGGYAQAVSTGIQFLSVPLLISAWGSLGYGEWLAISAIPIYMGLFDLGISNTTGNLMALESSIKQRVYIFNQGWKVCSVSYFSALLVFSFLALMVDWVSFFEFEYISHDDVAFIILGLAFHVFFVGQMQIVSSVYKAEKKFPEVMFFLNTVRLFEWAVALSLAYFGIGVKGFVLGLLITRILGFFLLVLASFCFGFKSYFLAILKSPRGEPISLISSSSANFLSSISVMLGVQGTILVLSVAWSGAAVAAFNVMRVLSRVIVQAVTVISQASWAEFSYAAGEKNYDLVGKLLRKSRIFSFMAGLVIGLFLYLFAQDIVNFWLGDDAFEIDLDVFLLLILCAMVHALWQIGWVCMMALNRHANFSYVMSIIVLLGTVVLYLVSGQESSFYAALCLLGVEFFILFFERFFSRGYRSD